MAYVTRIELLQDYGYSEDDIDYIWLSAFKFRCPRNLWNFPTFFQNRKITIIFEPKLVQDHYIDQNLVEIPPNTTKIANFSLKPVISSKIFGAFTA